MDGSIIDEDLLSFVVTFNNQPRAEDWFAVTLDQPETINRVVFAHGQTFHDGGWFDASAGKPRIQVKFTCQFPTPVKVFAIRVLGKPACGNNDKQAFASCAELQAFGGQP